jgi:hypothetical protein
MFKIIASSIITLFACLYERVDILLAETFQPSVVVLNDHRNIMLLIENILHDRKEDTVFT